MLNNTHRIVRLVSICYVASLLLVAGTIEAASAKENYNRFCTQCHGATGKGDGVNATDEMPVSPRDHTSAKEMAKLTSEDVYFAIKDGGKSVGKSSLMPRWGSTINDGEVKDLVKYLNTLCNCKYKAE